MRKWQLITAATVGIMASGSGFIQADAAIFSYEVDFLDKEVSDFDDFTPVFNPDTYNLNAKIEMVWFGTYYFDDCSGVGIIDLPLRYQLTYRLNNTGSTIILSDTSVPPFACTTSPTQFQKIVTVDLPDSIVEAIMRDDANFVRLGWTIQFRPIGAATVYNPKELFLENYENYFNVFYEFNTTYLFNYFLSDQQFISRSVTRPGDWTFSSTQTTFLEYVYTTAGNDTYIIFNSLEADISTTRKKYAINYEDLYFRGESVGAQFRHKSMISPDSMVFLGNTQTMNYTYDYYFLNTANLEQELSTVPEFNFEYEDCGSFLALNVGCFINNGLAYITNDAPIISDAITLLNAGMQMAGQAFGVIGSFTEDNVFGVLVLGGLGITAVRWFLKND